MTIPLPPNRRDQFYNPFQREFIIWQGMGKSNFTQKYDYDIEQEIPMVENPYDSKPTNWLGFTFDRALEQFPFVQRANYS